MPITWSTADVSPSTLASVAETAAFSWSEFSVAYELSLVVGGKYRRKELYNQIFEKDKEKKRKVIELILKVKGKTIKDNVKIAAKSGVTKNISDNSVVAGFPAQDIMKWKKSIIALRK